MVYRSDIAIYSTSYYNLFYANIKTLTYVRHLCYLATQKVA